MILYAESSAVLRWLFNEERADDILQSLQDAKKVTTSRLTLIECRRVIRRSVLEKRLTSVQGSDLLALLARAAATWSVLEITRDIALRAESTFPEEPVRTLDAIHLASALALRSSLPDLTLLSTDAKVRLNGLQLGFDVLPS